MDAPSDRKALYAYQVVKPYGHKTQDDTKSFLPIIPWSTWPCNKAKGREPDRAWLRYGNMYQIQYVLE